MAISYEEALATLQSMFGEPWTRESLDAILRHQKGHMENTVDFILRHNGKDPDMLVSQLQAGINPDESNVSMDAALARQLASGSGGPAAQTYRGRGTPTVLPSDFLCIPGRAPTANMPSTAGASIMESDAALARMLQDELFSEELARNPDFAHLARNRPSSQARISDARMPRASMTPPPPNSPNLVNKITELGDVARKRLQLLAAQFHARNAGGVTREATAGGHRAERRGLLDNDDNDDMELAARKDL
jgi:hypothetical protein